jgi:pyruvate carboxylase subunit B
MKKILFQDTSYRDGFQSVFGARAITKDFIPAVEAGVAAGITHFEAGGGARFQSLFMYCGESAFDMMDKFRAAVGPDIRLQTLARGINVVALDAQPKDMIDLHAKMFKKHGITRIRNFDALNDVRNLIYSGERIHAAGLEHEVVVTMMELPPGCSGAHDPEFYIKTLKQILDSGVPYSSVCFKDASGTSNPRKVYETFKQARKLLGPDVELRMHTHDTCGTGISQYLAAIEGGCDGVCLARAPLSGGTSQPDLISMDHALKGTDFTLDINVEKIMEANSVAKECFKDYFFPPEALAIDSEVILSPMPGGALTANTMMMRDTGTLHLFPKVITAMSECVARGGFGTSVTPVSQFYFQQAYANVTQGPWKKMTDGYGKMVLGYFGKTPVPPDPEIVAIAAEQLGKKPFSGDPVEALPPGIPIATKMLQDAGLEVNDENIFITGALNTPGSNKGIDFLKGNFSVNVRKISQEAKKPAAPAPTTPAASSASPGNYTVTVNGTAYSVSVAEGSGEITSVAPVAKAAASPAPTSSGVVTEVKSNLPGNVLKISVKVGDVIKENDTLLIIEAMKMENEIKAPTFGKVISIAIAERDVVQPGQLLVTLG